MANTEDRVVKMEFDNKAFEKNVSATLSSLQKLEQALKLDGVKKSLTDLNNTAKHLNIAEGVSQGIEGVSAKFLAMGAVGFSVIDNLVTKFLGFGQRIAAGFSLGPLQEGFQEYQTNIGSIQTILANTAKFGTTLPQVTASLDELNTYSDKTIYNFGEMVKNIGLFTNAGINIEDATSMIKGFSNEAAVSGVSAANAASAAYQLSQALSAGEVRLMDWKSLTNVGLGNDNMKNNILEIAQAMGTLKKTNTSAVDIQEDFNGTLETGWLTADVMSNYLKIMSGDMSAAEQAALGLSDATIVAFQKQQTTAQEAATKVRTFTQLISTVKESIGSGWSETFRNVIGNFTEATDLFTKINTGISGFVGKMSESRNKVLADWSAKGGRFVLFASLYDAVTRVGAAFGAIGKAFRNVFPRKTGDQLVALTVSFSKFLKVITPSPRFVEILTHVMTALFSILKVGWTVIRETAQFIGFLVKSIAGAFGGKGIGDAIIKWSDFITSLVQGVSRGQVIEKFFDSLSESAKIPIKFITELIAKIKEFFSGLDFGKEADKAGENLSKVGESFSIFDRIIERFAMFGRGLQTLFEGFKSITAKIGNLIKDFFGGLVDAVGKATGQSDFSTILDLINVGLLGGLAFLFKRFMDRGIINFFDGGFFQTIKQTIGELGNTLKTFQGAVKANALKSIAISIAILTASLLVLSLIDSDALTKALLALTVAFGELIASFALLQKLSSGKNALGAKQFAGIAFGFILIASALLIFAVAAKVFETVDWEGIGKSLVAFGGFMGGLVAGMKIIENNSEDIAKAGLAMIGIAIAMLIFAKAIEMFSKFPLGQLATSIAAIAGSLVILAKAIDKMPKDSEKTGFGLIEIGIGLLLLGHAVDKLGGMDVWTLAKGLAAIALGLKAISAATNNIPAGLPQVGAGLILIGGALLVMSYAIQKMADISFGDLVKGIASIAAVLIVLETAANGMINALPAAAAIAVMAAALFGLAVVIKMMAEIPFGALVKGVAAIAATILVLSAVGAIAQTAAPPLLAIGIAILALAAGFFLFAAAAFLAAKAMEIVAGAGKGAVKKFGEMLKEIGKTLPSLFIGFAEGILEFADIIAENAPKLAEAFFKFLDQIIVGFTEFIPKIHTFIATVIDTILKIIVEKIPEIQQAGLDLLLALMRGISENVQEIVAGALAIVNAFLDAIDEEVPAAITRITDTFIFIMQTVAFNLGKIAATMMGGLSIQFVQGFIKGLSDNWGSVGAWIKDKILGLIRKFKELLGIKSPSTVMVQIGKDIIQGLLNGLKAVWNTTWSWLTGIAKSLGTFIKTPINLLFDVGKQVVQGLWYGIKSVWNKLTDWLGDAAGGLIDIVKTPFKILSPSRVMMGIGSNIVEGLSIGLQSNWSSVTDSTGDLADHAKKNLMAAFSSVAQDLGSMDEFNPVITPVLDLSAVRTDASRIAGYMNVNSLAVSANSTQQAQLIASSPVSTTDATDGATVSGGGNVIFEQTINAPEQLSVADIYRQTRNQIAIAKEELKIPS